MAGVQTYTLPHVTLNTTGAQVPLITGAPGRVIMWLGDAPMGPPIALVSPTQAQTLYGDPTQGYAANFKLPVALALAAAQRPSGVPGISAGPVGFLVVRVGAASATWAAPDQTTPTPVTALTFNGLGAYFGTKGQKLEIVINATGVAPNQTVTSILIYDNTVTTAPVLLQQYYATQQNLSSNQAIADTINGQNPADNPNSVVSVTVGVATTVVAPTPAPGVNHIGTPLTGGADGKGAAFNDATIANLLAQSMAFAVDYICPLFDLAQIAPTLLAHVQTAQTNMSFRKVYGAPMSGINFSALSTNYTAGFQSGRFVCLGHDKVTITNPITGSDQTVDGYYLAAAVVGMKATAPVPETLDGIPLQGINRIPYATGKSGPLQSTDYQALGLAGCATVGPQPGIAGVAVNDLITTAPMSINNQTNPMYQANCQDIDDAVSAALVRAANLQKGRAQLTQASANAQFQSDINNEIAPLSGSNTINGVNSLVTLIDPATLAPTANFSYITRFPNINVIINSGFTYL